MAEGALYAKLCEMDAQIARMHSRIRKSESLNLQQIHDESQAIIKECRKNENDVLNSLKCSRAEGAPVLLNVYEKIEEAIRQMRDTMEKKSLESRDEEAEIERKLLFAEYELDFVMLAANRALAASINAMEEQLAYQMERKSMKK